MSPELSLSLEEGLSQDLALSTDSDSDDDCVGDEWESIASLPPPPSDLPSRGVHSTAMVGAPACRLATLRCLECVSNRSVYRVLKGGSRFPLGDVSEASRCYLA